MVLTTKERLCQERRKRRLRLLKITLCFGFFLLLAAGCYKLVHQSWFSFGKIEVTGTSNIKREEVMKAMAIEGPVNLFLLDRRRLEKSLEQDFRVQKADISYAWPNVLLVEIKERRPAFYIKCAYGGFAQLDFDGYVISVAKGIRDSAVLYVSGIDVGNSYLGDRVQNADALKILAFLGRLDRSLLSMISEISVDSNQRVKVIMLSGVHILLGEIGGIEAKADNFITICNEIKNKNIEGYYIDLTFAKPYIKVKR